MMRKQMRPEQATVLIQDVIFRTNKGIGERVYGLPADHATDPVQIQVAKAMARRAGHPDRFAYVSLPPLSGLRCAAHRSFGACAYSTCDAGRSLLIGDMASLLLRGGMERLQLCSASSGKGLHRNSDDSHWRGWLRSR